MLTTQAILQELITLWVVIDPIGTLPVFLAVTAGMSPEQRRSTAFRAIAISISVLLLFIVIGQIVLEALGLSLASFQIAGGLVLLLFALSMIFGDSKPETEMASVDTTQTAIFPLAMPSIASPGAMLAVVVLTDNDRNSIAHQAMTTGIMGVVMLAALGILLAANPIHRVIGNGGASIISRIMGMILAAVAVDAMLNGMVAVGALAPFE